MNFDRFQEDSAPFNAAQAHRRGDDVTFSVAVLQCENCGRTGERLTRVPEFDYMGCDDCMEEALAVIAREACERGNVRVEECDDVNDEHVVRHESITCRDCGEDLVERKGELVARVHPAKYEPMQGVLFSQKEVA